MELVGLGTEVVVVLTRSGTVMAGPVASNYAPSIVLQSYRELVSAGRIRELRDVDEWDGYGSVGRDAVVHIELRKWGDLVLVAPCTANTLAKLAVGLCDNLASSVLRAWDPRKPVIVAPAMNAVMWAHPATAEHLNTLTKRSSVRVVPPVFSKKIP